MKKTFTANIGGQVFIIDEDAYSLLNNYIEELRHAFPGNDGAEIIDDIESRIRELLAAKCPYPSSIVGIEAVKTVIATMGKPDDICGDDNVEATQSASKMPKWVGAVCPGLERGHKRLYRNTKNRVFGGVVGGLATYLGWNSMVLRLIFAVAALCTYFMPFFIIYLIAWMILPPAQTTRQVLQMNGEPVCPETIGQVVVQQSNPVQEEGGGFWATLFRVLGKIVLSLIGLVAIGVEIGMLVGLCAVIVVAIQIGIYADTSLLESIDLPLTGQMVLSGVVMAIVLMFTIAYIAAVFIWMCCIYIFDLKTPSRTTILSLTILTVILCVASVVMITLASQMC